MGTACARCNEIEKSKSAANPSLPANLEQLEASEDEHDDGSEVVPSSEDEEDGNDYKQDVEDTLKATGANLKRGKTLAMKEAITTAKKLGLQQDVIKTAEDQLEEHKKREKRLAMAQDVQQFFETSTANEIPQVEKMLKKAKDADCDADVIARLEKHLDELIITRPLETDEADIGREYMKKSCMDFVLAATKGGGRPVVFLNLSNGKKVSATLSIDPVLQNLILTIEENEENPYIVPVQSMSATTGLKENSVRSSKAFKNLEDDDSNCAVALKFEKEDKPGVWCLIEPTVIRRDRLIEAFLILSEACRQQL